jgi:DNA-binding NarL/FixJ family response regulator
MGRKLAAGRCFKRVGNEMAAVVSTIIALADREFSQGCLSHWLRACCPEFDVLVAADLGRVRPEECASPPVAIVLHPSCSGGAFDWIEQQIEIKGRYCVLGPIVLIVDAFDANLAQNLVSSGVINAFIPTSDTTEVAAAALRLVIAGGRYMPSMVQSVALPLRSPAGASYHLHSDIINVLTSRERAVLELLKTGKPNKLIAHDLSMSLSTAKVHVHNIMRKLKVNNRTEAVIATSEHPTAKVEHLEFDMAAKDDDHEMTPHLATRYHVRAPRAGDKAH